MPLHAWPSRTLKGRTPPPTHTHNNVQCVQVLDANLRLAYHGQMDDTRPSGKGGDGRQPTGEDLRHALDCVLAGRPNERRVRPSIGW